MESKNFRKIFQKSSQTYFYSSLFFPKIIKKEVFILYSFVRSVDNFIDTQPQDIKGFYHFWRLYQHGVENNKTENALINEFCKLSKRRKFQTSWVEAFFKAMESDLKVERYQTIKEVENYIYGSAEVVGLMMASIMDLPQRAYSYAQDLGKSMQYINFIRDIEEDRQLGRVYLPQDEIEKYGLKNLRFESVSSNPEKFKEFIHAQVDSYSNWQTQAEKGFQFIPKRLRIAIMTASDMYKFTAREILKNPLRIYERKIKPSKIRVISRGIINSIK